MSNNHARINPKRREIDFVRLAEAILLLALEVEDESLLQEGRTIHEHLRRSEEGAA